MSTQKIYTIYDSKSEAYMKPMFLRSHGEAIRVFEAACQTSDHEFHRFPEDFTLFHLGEWDDSTALFQMNMTPIPLARSIEVVARQPVTQLAQVNAA